MAATTKEESNPPERKAPRGTSDISCSFTLAKNFERSSSTRFFSWAELTSSPTVVDIFGSSQ